MTLQATATLPTDLARSVADIVRLSPGLTYKTTQRDGATHRAERAALRYMAGACVPTDTPGVWLVESFRHSGTYHSVSVDGEFCCDCPDAQRREVCWHIFAATFAETRATRCASCGDVMEHRPRFSHQRDQWGDKVFVGAHVCDDCGYAKLDNGEESWRDGEPVATPAKQTRKAA